LAGDMALVNISVKCLRHRRTKRRRAAVRGGPWSVLAVLIGIVGFRAQRFLVVQGYLPCSTSLRMSSGPRATVLGG